jgi:hypothetical protein
VRASGNPKYFSATKRQNEHHEQQTTRTDYICSGQTRNADDDESTPAPSNTDRRNNSDSTITTAQTQEIKAYERETKTINPTIIS